jgi:plastocyanin
MSCRRARQLVGVGGWIIAWSVLVGATRPASGGRGEGGSQEPARVEGIVTYTGPLADPIPIPEAGTERRPIEVAPETRGLKDAVVWLEGATVPAGSPKGPKSDPIRMDQRDYQFLPHVLAITAGEEVEFLNSDAANHGVTASSPEPRNRFDVSTSPGVTYRHRFVASGRPVAIGCPIHGAMSAWIYVLDHPYHAVTDARGSFRLPPVPPGRYVLHVRHPDGGMGRRQEIDVRTPAPVRVRIEFGEKDRKTRRPGDSRR